MTELRYLRVDVFTATPFGGNPLAVFPDADGLDPATMARIAREMNLSETVFCRTPRAPQADVALRIFTTDREVPLAGHPTVGTVHALAEAGRLAVGDGETVVQCELGVGVLPVEVQRRSGRIGEVTMTQRAPRFGAPFDDAALVADALGLQPADLLCPDLPVRVVDTGIPWLLIPIVDRRRQLAIRPDFAACHELARRTGTDLIHAFTQETVDHAATAHTRHVFFGTVTPGEDPATGSAAGCLGAYLVHEQVVFAAPEADLWIEQGHALGRPGRMRVRVATSGARINQVRVGGESVTVGEGVLRF